MSDLKLGPPSGAPDDRQSMTCSWNNWTPRVRLKTSVRLDLIAARLPLSVSPAQASPDRPGDGDLITVELLRRRGSIVFWARLDSGNADGIARLIVR